jgi:RNA polymerase sigma-B factor
MTAAADPGAWSRGNLERCDDCELVHKVQSLPRASAEREAACEVLIVRYQSLVRSCAVRYREAPETTEELMQAGYVGLLKAINNFDPAIGTNLAVYAQPCITGEIKRHFRDTRWHVHVNARPRSCGSRPGKRRPNWPRNCPALPAMTNLPGISR